MSILILGSGLAGYNLAREIRKLDQTTPLLLVSRDRAPFYSKPMLSNALASGKTADSLIIKPAEKMAEELNARILPRRQVAAIDPAARSVTLAGGETLTYHDLVLALGADPIRLPLSGDGTAEVLSINDLDDFARFIARLDGTKRVAILGAGLIGCEFANDLLARGIVPTVLDPSPWPLGRLLPEGAGRYFQARLEEAGVHFRMGVAASAIHHAGSAYRLELSDGSQLDTELVLSAVGLRPRTSLAATAGLSVNRGVVVNRQLAGSVPHVFAIGDCAEVEGLSLPYVMPIMQQVRALARTLTGCPTDLVYPAMPVIVKTPAVPTVIAAPPPEEAGAWTLIDTDGGLEALFHGPDARLRGFALLGTGTVRKQALSSQLPPPL